MSPVAFVSTASSASESSFSDRMATLLARVECRRVDSEEGREAIFHLRYLAYLREGAISANPSGRFADAYDEADNAYIFGLYVDGELASSLRLHVASKEYPHSPSLGVFSDVLQPLLETGKVLVDSTRFVADERLSRLHRGLPYATLRICMLAAEYFGADHILAAVRAEHQAFYRRAFGHQLLCEPRPYPQLTKPISLMTVHFPSAAERLYRRYPFFRSSVFEQRTLFEHRQRSAAQAGHKSADSKVAAQSRGAVRPSIKRENRRLAL
jgi:N-acyl-L-homoserine lactone synthetase